MGYANPDDKRDKEQKYAISRNHQRRFDRVSHCFEKPLATLMFDQFMQLLERGEQMAGINHDFSRRRTDCIRPH